jgi:hypothetical protein
MQNTYRVHVFHPPTTLRHMATNLSPFAGFLKLSPRCFTASWDLDRPPEEGEKMKQQQNRQQEPHRMGNAVMVVTMLLSLCVLTYIKAQYCSNPFRKCRVFFFSIHGIWHQIGGFKCSQGGAGNKLDVPTREDFDPTRPTCTQNHSVPGIFIDFKLDRLGCSVSVRWW